MSDKPTLATAYIGLIPVLDGSKKQIENELGDVDTDSAGKKAGGRFGKALGAAAMVGIGAVMAGATAVLKTGFQEAMDASAGNAQLAAGIKSTGNAANVTVKGLNEMASSIQNMSGQTDDSITAAQKLLLTFTEIKNTKTDKIFDQATLAAANMASKMGTDASSQAILLGKALNNPIKGLGALTRVGVAFTDGQKETIKKMVEAGDVAGAQAIILKELETEFGGAAEAAGKSLPGQLEIMKRRFEDVSQSIAEKLIPVVLPMLQRIASLINDKVLPAVNNFIQGFKDGTGAGGRAREIFERIRTVLAQVAKFVREHVVPAVGRFGQTLAREVVPRVQTLARWVSGTLVPALMSTGRWIVRNKDWLAALAVTIGTAVVIWKAYTTALLAWKAVQTAAIAIQTLWNAVMAANPIGLIVIAVAALVAGLTYFFTKTELGKKIWQAFTDFLVKAWEWIKTAAGKLWDFLKRVFSWSPLGIIIKNWDKIVAGFKWYIATAKAIFQGIWDFIKKVWSYSPIGIIVKNWDKIIGFFKEIPGRVKDIFTRVTNSIKDAFKAAFNWVARGWNNTLGKLKFTIPDIPGVPGRGKSFSFPQIPMLATGGMVTRTGDVLVGERGPELLRAPRGASVVPLDHPTARAAQGGVTGNTFNIYEQSSAESTALAVTRRMAFAGA